MMYIPDDLYKQILAVFPIPCVDLRITDDRGRVLLVMRNNEPARGEWWFPGGRIHFLESRHDAAVRKLREECGLSAREIREIGTFDVILDLENGRGKSHGITTVYDIAVGSASEVLLDDQSAEARWERPEDWARSRLHPFIREWMTMAVSR